ncbi:MAG: DNA cytosine methyltransferase [Nitrospirae bacterium]|nr:DNA cytosine methyltransferase [Nitrospirota bacterium]
MMLTVSLFSGCGGLDYGFEAAGCDVVLRNDFDKYSCNTLRLNARSNVIEAPLEEVSESDIRKVVGWSHEGVDLVIGGPPCQPFSKSAYWSKGDTLRLNDPRSNTLGEYFRVVQELRPRAFLLENVHGINYSGKEEGFQFILNQIRKINRAIGTDYRPVWRVLNAADFGVPQLRVRFFLVALRDGKEFRFPEATHRDVDTENHTLLDISRESYVTVWDAIGAMLPEPSEKLEVGGKWANLLPSIPEGENYLWHTDRKGGLPMFGWRTRYWCFLLKLAKSRPSWTIQAQPGSAVGPFHWTNRKLSWKELTAIQTFPRSFRIDGPRVEIQRQIGNAVPSLLSEVVAREIVNQVTGKKFRECCKLKMKRVPFVPPPEAVSDVPREYRPLIGRHAPHPGTGKGRAYRDNAQQGAAQGGFSGALESCQ